VDNEYCAKHSQFWLIQPKSVRRNNCFPFATASGSVQCSLDAYDMSSDDEDYWVPKNVTQSTPGWRDCAARLLTAARLHLISLPESLKNWGPVNQKLNDYHSDRIEISSTFWLPDITNWWRQQGKTLSQHADLSDVAQNILSIIPHGVGVEARSSLGWDDICSSQWLQSESLFAKQSL